MPPRILLMISLGLALLGLGGALAGRNSLGRAGSGWHHATRGLSPEQLDARRQELAAFRAEMLAAGLKEASTTRTSNSGPEAADWSGEDRVTLRGDLPEIGAITLELATRRSDRPTGSSVTVGAEARDLRRPEARKAWGALLDRLKRISIPPSAE